MAPLQVTAHCPAWQLPAWPFAVQAVPSAALLVMHKPPLQLTVTQGFEDCGHSVVLVQVVPGVH